MHRIVVNVQTGEVTQVELTAEEIAAIEAANAAAAAEIPAVIPAEQTTGQ